MTQLHRRMQATTYQQWIAAERIDVVPGHHIADLRALPVKPWPRNGGAACFINHDDTAAPTTASSRRSPPAPASDRSGTCTSGWRMSCPARGTTAVWQEGGAVQAFEWQEGSLFAVPLNGSRQHFNSSGQTPVRPLSVTNLPAVMKMFADPEFVFRCSYAFTGRFRGDAGYLNAEGTLDGTCVGEQLHPRCAHVRAHRLQGARRRGKNIQFKLVGNTMGAHISEFPVGTYKKGHRHGPGAHVVILNGSGYSLMGKEGAPVRLVRGEHDHPAGPRLPPALQHRNSISSLSGAPLHRAV